MIPVVLLLLLLPVFQAKDNIPYCPNGHSPKLDTSGTPLICLPGQSSKLICGKGYACFFSGYNYQCCPQGEDEENEQLECPMSSLTVLDAVGDPLHCDKVKCPKDTMFCSKQGTTAICCESLIAASQESTPIKTTTTPVEIVEECPGSSLTVLNDEGNPHTCSARRSCPQPTMKCQTVGKVSICCEPLYSASSKEDNLYIKEKPQTSFMRTPAERKIAEKTFNPLKYVDNHLTRTVPKNPIAFTHGDGEVKTRHTSSAVLTNAGVKKVEKLPEFIDGDLQLRKEEASPTTEKAPSTLGLTTSTSLPKTTTHRQKLVDGDIEHKEKPRAHGIPSAPETDFEYRPHSSGGYALSEKPISKVRPPLQPNAKKIARKFLIDQIKNGWPYDERFYRPNEYIEFVQSGGRSIAAVHFPS
ncbi:hypothetical protein L596_003626 [Steinernema carpocapsae]|uniref:WAP domain-containing protein n=1 Tax=Steinernema carpocapsae TaxID=34508 RepID=A0A4U8UUT6_STECR|nr:hypothetical protein L596_003626 [Steinernema carpocapsae]